MDHDLFGLEEERAMQPGGITHRVAYQDIRNYLAGRFVGATRDEALLEEVVKCLFCKAWLSAQEMPVSQTPRDALELALLYRSTFADIRRKLPSVFDPKAEILLDPRSLQFVHDRLASVDLRSVDADPLGDAYQMFTGSAIRGSEGQFFTPPAAVAWLVEAIDPAPGERLVDPACGTGSFLSYAARYLASKGASADTVSNTLVGFEKDKYLAKLASQHLALITLRLPTVSCADSLAFTDVEGGKIPDASYLGQFDAVLTNPPFGTRIVSASDEIRSSFQLARKWKKETDGTWSPASSLATKSPPQILFIERIVSLLKPGGRAGCVVPESLISSPKHAYVVQFLRRHGEVLGVVGMPESLFKTSGKGGTHTKTCLLIFRKREEHAASRRVKPPAIFLAEAQWCGHDSRGNTVPKDDLPGILTEYKKGRAGSRKLPAARGIWLPQEKIQDDVLAPRYYDPEGLLSLQLFRESHDLLTFGNLVDRGVVSYSTGVEVGKLAYGTGDVPFVRTSDISNWEIKMDPKHCVSENLYKQHARKLDIQDGDILMVKDGTYLVGSCAIITRYDRRILFQSHLYKIRVLDRSLMSPYLLLAILSCEPVQRQVRAKRLTQDIIDSLGRRILDLVLPIPKKKTLRDQVESMVKKVIDDRIEARELARRAKLAVLDKVPGSREPLQAVG